MKKSSKKQCPATTEDTADEDCPPTRDIVRIVDADMLPWLFNTSNNDQEIETPADGAKDLLEFGIGGDKWVNPTPFSEISKRS